MLLEVTSSAFWRGICGTFQITSKGTFVSPDRSRECCFGWLFVSQITLNRLGMPFLTLSRQMENTSSPSAAHVEEGGPHEGMCHPLSPCDEPPTDLCVVQTGAAV